MKNYMPGIILVLLLAFGGGGLCYFVDWSQAFKKPELSEYEKRRQEVLKAKSAALASMPKEARQLMEYQKREYARAYRNAYKNLSEADREKIKNIKIEIRKNRDEHKAFFESLSESEQRVLRYPLSAGVSNTMEVSSIDPRIVQKNFNYEKKRKELMEQIPQEVRDVELPDEVKKDILDKGKKIEEDFMKNGTASR